MQIQSCEVIGRNKNTGGSENSRPPFLFERNRTMSLKRSLMLGCALEALKPIVPEDGSILCLGPYFPKRSAGHRDSSWSQTILKAKNGDRWVIMVLGQILAAHLEYWLGNSKEYVMTYVPGKNTLPERLVKEACSHWNGNVRAIALLKKNGRARSQHRCRLHTERIGNVKDRFEVVNGEHVAGKAIILADDIVTSGATMRECHDVLKQNGARSVIGIALARSVNPRRL
jgi:predicted amidophosphoribosyltransferase